MNSGQAARFAAFVIVSASSAFAEGTAVVGRDRVNVRGAASLSAEVVTQLSKGETVVVLEPVTLLKAGKGEPTNWFKIQLPANTPVWVNSGFVSSSNTVSASKLNVRGGPGENYSVLARLVKGDAVSPIRQVDDWMEIHPPTNAVAFVAATYLQLSGDAPTAPAPSVAQASEPSAKPDLSGAPKAQEKPAEKPAEKPVIAAEPPAPKVEETAVAQPEPIAPAVSQPPVVNPPPVVANPVPPVEAPPVVVAPAAPKRRVVVREGILRRDFHINTPGYFQLVDKYQGRLINYLYVSNKELDLGPFAGSVVIVRGEEYLDERWKRTPVIEVEHATLPN